MMLVLVVLAFREVMGLGRVYDAGGEPDVNKDPDPFYMDDPEPEPVNLYDPKHYNEDFIKREHGEEKLAGYMFAGRSEFPWIVDVRFDTEDSYEIYSTGNILSKKHVVTVCRTILFANSYRDAIEREQEKEISSVDNIRYSMNLYQEWIAMKVIYCANFEWVKVLPRRYKEQHRYAPDVRQEFAYEGGEIKVVSIAAHPKCRENSLIYDFSMLQLAKDIVPMPPVLTYMPIYYDIVNFEISPFDLSHHVEYNTVCYVGSFGRPYNNSIKPPTLDYKTKYRVYYMSWHNCTRIWGMLGDKVTKGLKKPYWCAIGEGTETCILDEDDKTQLMCLNTRSRVGSICDHDRGSPVVCDGYVYGFVTRGAQFKFCHNSVHIPFIAVRITAVRDYFRITNRNKYFLNRHKTTTRARRRWGHIGRRESDEDADRRSRGVLIDISFVNIIGASLIMLIRHF